MNIHTTQNLNSLVQYRQSTNHVSSRDFRLKNYSEQLLMPKLSAETDFMSNPVSFKGKGEAIKNGKKVIKQLNRKVGEIAKDAQPEVKKGDKLLNSPLFNKILDIAEYETVIQAAMAAIICIGLRPATILALPSGKSKQDNTYAASHSIASGIVGLISTIILTTPFKAGANHVMKVMLKDLKKEALERLYPQLNLESIVDKTTGKRKEVKEWLDKTGNKFSTEIKDVEKLPKFRSLSKVSEVTFSKILKADVDWAAQKGKSFNDVTLKDGRKLYDAVDMNNLGIVVDEEGINTAQILLRDLDKEYLADLIKDSEGNAWGRLDIKSVYDKNSNVKDFRQWKDIKGKEWKLDLDNVFVSSPLETADYRPRITGKKRFDKKDQVYKFTTYQKNGVNGGLGTEITNKMVEAEARNEGHTKLLTWLPDLAFRIPIAATTIALIPWILRSVFHIEKTKKNKKSEPAVQTEQKPIEQNKLNSDKAKDVNFKGKGDGKKASWFVRKFGEWYGKPLLENEGIAKLSEKLASLPGNITQHMATLGSLITSSVYVERTLTNKDLDVERRRTLAINQILCFFIPTIAAYTVDSLIKGWTKNKEYRYSGLQEQKKALADYEGKAVKGMSKDLGKSLKGVRILASLATFTLIYRYATPVIITPIANWLGDRLNARKAKETEIIKEMEEKEEENTKAA